jgi:hypothetical protein
VVWSQGGVEWRAGVGVLAMLFATACSDAAGQFMTERASTTGGASNASADASVPNSEEQPEAARLALFDSFSPQGLPEGGGGEAGEGPGPLGPPYGTSTGCGDAIVGSTEECDDGAGGADACTGACQTRDQPAGALPQSGQRSNDRYLGAGRHPVAGSLDGFITAYVEEHDEGAAVGATLFNIWGQPSHFVTVSEGGFPIYEANPVAAALPGGDYAVAWSDFDGDGSDLGVALRRVDGDGELGSLRSANTQTEFSQLNPDLVWTDGGLVVAWEDYSDPLNGPDLRYRVFDQALSPTSTEQTLASSDLPEAAVALASFNGGWAAAYREGTEDGKENIVVRAGDESFRIGPIWGGPLDDRPALVELDETHLLVVFSADPMIAGTINVPRLKYAVVDIESALPPEIRSLDPLDDLYTRDVTVAQLSPSATRVDDALFVAWRSEARAGDAAGDQLWLKRLSWDAARIPALEARKGEILMPRTSEASTGDQRVPALAAVGLPPHGALAMAWGDYSKVLAASSGEPDVIVQYAPVHATSASDPMTVSETWTGANGAPWPAQWVNEITSAGTPITLISSNEGRVFSQGGTLSMISGLKERQALDVEMVTKVRFNLNEAYASAFARRTTAEPGTYLAAVYSSSVYGGWRIVALVDGVVQTPNVATGVMPYLFSYWAQGTPHWFKFRVENQSDGSITVAAKVWVTSIPEPATWTMQGSIAATSPLAQTFRNRVGQFGVGTSHGIANRETRFDDYSATYYDVAEHGDFDQPAPPVLLRRAPAYGSCTLAAPCSFPEGTCESDAECAAGQTCQLGRGEELGLGSHARVCVASHCQNQLRDADEIRLNCGGDDCAPCACTSTAVLGAETYCSPTCPCGSGEGDCDGDSECASGLICHGDNGPMFGLGDTFDVCVPAHCKNRQQDTALGETNVDCGGPCGSCDICGADNGSVSHCRVFCRCPSGEGTCRFDDECQAGTECGSTKTGQRFGLPAGTTACVLPHCDNNQFEPAKGETAKDCGGPCGTCP